jgi:ApaG protein
MFTPRSNSVALTDGIRVKVESRYLPEQSSPRVGRYVWAYTVRIENEGDRAAKLVSRHWIITDGRGGIEEVRGPGVVGEQPHLEPGERFQYTSGCVLTTTKGSMRGSYQMVRDDGTEFEAEVAGFALELPPTLN